MLRLCKITRLLKQISPPNTMRHLPLRAPQLPVILVVKNQILLRISTSPLRATIKANGREFVGSRVNVFLIVVLIVACSVLQDPDNLVDLLLYWELKFPSNSLGPYCVMLLLITSEFEHLFLFDSFLPLFLGEVYITSGIVSKSFLGALVTDLSFDLLLEFFLLFFQLYIIVAPVVLLTNQFFDVGALGDVCIISFLVGTW